MEAIGDTDLITLLIALAGKIAVQSSGGATLISKSNFFKVPHVSIDDEGTILAQVAVAGAGNRNSMPHLDDFCPGIERIWASRNLSNGE